MPGLDLSQLSSNWKKLQGQLEADKKTNNSGHGVKRERPAAKIEAPNGHKRIKLAEPTPKPRTKNLKMGSSPSKPPEDRATATTNHPSSKQNGDATSTGPSSLSAQVDSDEINAGLHPMHRAGKYIALDCEMVGTGPPPHLDNLLARASLVNYHGEQLYDSYVLPPPGNRVEDYRTFVSGIKPSHLQPGYARPFAQVQADVAKLLKGRVLVGHALRNDLAVLGFGHPKRDLRDTARYSGFRKKAHGPPALRLLAKEVLGLEIQAGEHSSLEDARAAMALFRRGRVGFEGEVRRRFGARSSLGKGGKGKVDGDGIGDGDEEDESDEVEVLDGEVDSDEDGESLKEAAPSAKKKRKKKKRTKRK
jgi:RNA exonuclease 4